MGFVFHFERMVRRVLTIAFLAFGFFILLSLQFSPEAHATYLTRVDASAANHSADQASNKVTKKKFCVSGQLCGHVCISRRYVCHRPPAKKGPTKQARHVVN